MTPPLPRPDALAVRPLGSHAVVPPDAALALFGAPLRGAEHADVVRLGRVVARVPVETGATLRLVLGADVDTPADGLRLAGPVGAASVAEVSPVRSHLVLPAGLSRAWGVGAVAVVSLGSVAVRVPVEAGLDTGLSVDRALWLSAGRPATARWLPQTDWAEETPEGVPDTGALIVPRRVVTETDVRQARTRHRTIRLTTGQIVTPAAATLAREWNVFEA
ncbi:MAG TPA: hypothetical protein VF594_04055 [Rubricoccaceae bacterium]